MKGLALHMLAALALSALLGYVAYLSPGHSGTDEGAGLACAICVFLLVFVGPRGMVGDE